MKLVVIGGGEHARVIIEAAQSRPDHWEVHGYIDVESNPETERRLNVVRLGDDRDGWRLCANEDLRLVLGFATLGSHQTRVDLVRTYDDAGARWATVIHAQAWISPTARLGKGAFVSGGSVVNTGVRIDQHAVINTGAVVEHDAVIGPFTHIGPRAVIGGGAQIGQGVHVGLGASVRDHVSIGDQAVVGMGAVVVAGVSSNSVVFGNPARSRKS